MSATIEGDLTSCDWRRTPHLNPITNQGLANCCFAFAVCELIETFENIKHPTEPHLFLSPQDIYSNLIKDKEQDKRGCSLNRTIDWVRENGCILKESCPYQERFDHPVVKDRKMHIRIVASIGIDLTRDLEFKKEKDKSKEIELLKEIRKAPVAAQILWIKELENFKGDGIYCGPKDSKAMKREDPNDEDEYHAIMIIGFGEEMIRKRLIKYWIIKNSHDVAWGDGGFAKITRAPCHGRLLIDHARALKGVTKD